MLSAHDDLVAAVDFTDQYLVTGHEDSTVGVWDITTRPMNSVRVMPGLLTNSRNARSKLYYCTLGKVNFGGIFASNSVVVWDFTGGGYGL